MTTRETLLSLAARAEAADGPCEILNSMIAAEFGWGVHPDFTASADAALGLVPQGIEWGISTQDGALFYCWMVSITGAAEVAARTLPLALVAASLRLRAAMEDGA